jgi:hypothetical protein
MSPARPIRSRASRVPAHIDAEGLPSRRPETAGQRPGMWPAVEAQTVMPAQESRRRVVNTRPPASVLYQPERLRWSVLLTPSRPM